MNAKFYIFIFALFIGGCANKEQPNYIGTLPHYAVDSRVNIPHGIACECCPPLRPPQIKVPSAPSSSFIIPAQPNFIPHMPEESRNRLKMLLTKRK